jgi:hypothetical protein
MCKAIFNRKREADLMRFYASEGSSIPDEVDDIGHVNELYRANSKFIYPQFRTLRRPNGQIDFGSNITPKILEL